MASSASSSSHLSLLPAIPELLNPNFLDVLVPAKPVRTLATTTTTSPVTNPMMDALKSTTRHTYTANAAPAYSSTDSATLDAFSSISSHSKWGDMESYLENAWKEDSNLTLRIIWNLRSIHDGKGEKESFYRAFGWLYRNHPRTAISNLRLLVEPVCTAPRKKAAMSHGYWKDLLNILALETVGELSDISSPSTFLHAPRDAYTYPNSRKSDKRGDPASRIEAARLANDQAKKGAAEKRKLRLRQMHDRLVRKLLEPKFKALFIAVARLFTDQLLKDKQVLIDLDILGPGEDRIAHLRKLSLAGKWAPTPGGSHDRVTNIATAISELLYASQALPAYPSVLQTPVSEVERAHVLRSFYQRWILTELRRNLCCPEPLMSANRWTEIKYSRVPSLCMQNCKELFFKHDPTGFEQFLIAVENGKKKISGATLLPHELVAEIIQFERVMTGTSSKYSALDEFKKKVAETQIRVIEAQWKTLINNLRESGSIENSIAICDVSGSMGYLGEKFDKKHVQPILPAVSLSLILASLAKPPFCGGFVTFSAEPQFVTVDLDQELSKQVGRIANSDWGMNTNFSSVFLDLLLPLAVKHQIKQEDMIKRLFVFSDMQFDDAEDSSSSKPDAWETNHDVIEKAYKKAGYEVPEVVYWDLSADGGPRTKETADSKKTGVAMMNGFSPAMLKVFMGEEELTDEWEKVGEDGGVVEKDVFNPVNVMMKALMKTSFDGLVVVD